MATEPQHFTLGKVKAYRAYFTQCRASAKGKPEFNDLDTTVKLCEQLVPVMQQQEPPKEKKLAKPQVTAAEKS